jgi:hypothetical protein
LFTKLSRIGRKIVWQSRLLALGAKSSLVLSTSAPAIAGRQKPGTVMAKLKGESEGLDLRSEHADPRAIEDDPIDEAPDDQGEIIATAATIAVVAIGAAVFEAALLPGLALGVVAALAPRVLPNLGSAMAPMFRSSVRGAYRLGQRTREMVAEAQEHVNDIVAEANAEDRSKFAATAKQAAPAA